VCILTIISTVLLVVVNVLRFFSVLNCHAIGLVVDKAKSTAQNVLTVSVRSVSSVRIRIFVVVTSSVQQIHGTDCTQVPFSRLVCFALGHETLARVVYERHSVATHVCDDDDVYAAAFSNQSASQGLVQRLLYLRAFAFHGIFQRLSLYHVVQHLNASLLSTFPANPRFLLERATPRF